MNGVLQVILVLASKRLLIISQFEIAICCTALSINTWLLLFI